MTRFSGLIAAGFALCVTSAANATLIVVVSTGGHTDTATDQVSGGTGGGDRDAVPGQVVFNSAIGAYTVNVIAAIEAPGQIKLQATDVRTGTGAASPITITAYDTGFTTGENSSSKLASAGNGTFTFTHTGGSDSVSFKSYIDTNNGADATAGPGVHTTGSQTATYSGILGSSSYVLTPGPVSTTVPLVGGHPYSLTEVLTVNASSPATTTFTGSATVTPEPATIGLAAVAGAAGLLRRRSSR